MSGTYDVPILYHSKTSVCSQKVRLVLSELGIIWNGHVLDLKKGDQFEADYTNLNPNASVPTYQEGSLILIESNEIMKYLSKRDAYNSHLAATKGTEAQVNRWMDASIQFHAAVHALTTLTMNRAKLAELNPDKLDEKLGRIPDQSRALRIRDIVENGLQGRTVTEAISYLEKIYQHLNTELGNRNFLCGQDVTLADFAVLPFVKRIGFLNLTPDWSDASYEHLDKWIRKMEDRPSYRSAILDFHNLETIEKYRRAGEKFRHELMHI